MPMYHVTGNIVSGAFTHTIKAESEGEAMELVASLPLSRLNGVSSEQAIAIPDSADLLSFDDDE